MNIRELKKQVYRRANKDIPFWHQINFSLAKWKFDALYINIGVRGTMEFQYVVEEVVDNSAWIVYDLDERGYLIEISLYQDSSEAESAFLSLLEKHRIIS